MSSIDETDTVSLPDERLSGKVKGYMGSPAPLGKVHVESLPAFVTVKPMAAHITGQCIAPFSGAQDEALRPAERLSIAADQFRDAIGVFVLFRQFVAPDISA